MSDATNKLAPAPSTPALSPEIAAPVTRTAPKPKPKRIPRKIVEATELLISGRAKNLADAARQISCSREYISRTLSARPDCVQYMQQKAARVLGVASTVAAARMAHLIHAESEHVSYRAAEHVLAISGITRPRDPQVAVSVSVRSGFLIDLRENDDRGSLPEIDADAAGATIVDAKAIDAKPADDCG